jgi:hypothetical protein
MRNYTVWVGGVEVNDCYVTKKVANILAIHYINNGYDDVKVGK